jgi:hypothetical protein
MATRHKGIIAYGTEEDRKKLAVLAQLSGKSGSEYLVDLIRSRYSEVVGEVDPEVILVNHS